MQNDKYLSLINLKVKFHRQRLFLINTILEVKIFWNVVNMVSRGVLHLFRMTFKHPTRYHGYNTQHGVLTPHFFFLNLVIDFKELIRKKCERVFGMTTTKLLLTQAYTPSHTKIATTITYVKPNAI